MKLISCHDGKLQTLDATEIASSCAVAVNGKTFSTGLPALDSLAPGSAFARGAVHELITLPRHARPLTIAAMLAKCAGTFAAVVWSDPDQTLYPPAIAAFGIPLERLFLLHPKNQADQVWATAECLRCKGVSVVVAELPELKRRQHMRVEARRLQLAAETGGTVGLLFRTARNSSAFPSEHAAVTRWFVQPFPGERNVQRWKLQLIFGHGGRVGESVILEHRRDPIYIDPTAAAGATAAPPVQQRFQAHPVHPPAELADRPGMSAAEIATG